VTTGEGAPARRRTGLASNEGGHEGHPHHPRGGVPCLGCIRTLVLDDVRILTRPTGRVASAVISTFACVEGVRRTGKERLTCGATDQ
jgi:hypothetical protein